MAGVLGVFLLCGIVCAVIGLLFKDNRNDKEYVKDTKTIIGYGLAYFVGIPLFFTLVMIVSLYIFIR